MEIIAFLDKAMAVEDLFSKCYEALASLSEPNFVPDLKRLSNEEINHRNSLNMQKTFAANAPDLFGATRISEAELDFGLDAIRSLLESVRSKKIGTRDAFGKLKELESRFERVHSRISVEIKDPSLQNLFKGLSAGDKNHIEVLEGILIKT